MANNSEVYVTPQPVSLAAAGSFQLPLSEAIDVMEYDSLDLTLTVPALSATSSPTLDVEIWTGMQKSTPDGWYKAANWSQVTAASANGVKLNVISLQKYIIWKVTLAAQSGTPGCTFFIAGVARQN